MVQQIGLAWSDVGVGEGLVNLQRLRLNPLTVLIVESLLRNLTDVDLGVEVRGESVMMVTGIAIDNVEIVYLVEVVLGGVCRIDTRDTRIKTTTQNGSQTSLLESVFIGPLPGILEVCLVLRLVVGCVEIVTATCQTSVHDCQVLIGQSKVDHQFWLVTVEKCLQLFHVIGIYLRRLDVHVIASLVDILHNLIAFSLTATGNHKVGKHVSILGDLERCHRSDASGANH